jgi:hypothetical protein
MTKCVCFSIVEVDDISISPEKLKSIFSVGDYVRAVIVRKNSEKKRISLSMKPSRFKDNLDNDAHSRSDSDDTVRTLHKNNLELFIHSNFFQKNEFQSEESDSSGENYENVNVAAKSFVEKQKQKESSNAGTSLLSLCI